MSIRFSVPDVKKPIWRVQQTKRVLPVLIGMLLFAFHLPAGAQDDLFITVSTPVAAATTPGQERADLFKTVSSSAAQPAATTPAQSVPTVPPVEFDAGSVPSESRADDKWERELLRDPFWPVGYFPADWKKEKTVDRGADLDEAGWKAASEKIRISGTSQLAGRTAAIINGELKLEGDLIVVLHEGKTYQWQITVIGGNGQVQLKRQGTE